MHLKIRKIFDQIIKYKGDAFILIFGQGLTFIITILGVKILTSVMSTSSYGELMLYNTIFTFTTLILYNPAQQLVSRYYNNVYNNGSQSLIFFEKVIFDKFIKNIGLNIILVCIFYIFLYYYNGLQSLIGTLFLLLYCILYSILILYTTAFNAVRKRVVSIFTLFLERLLKPLFGAILITIFYNSVEYALIGQFISSLTVFIILFYLYKSRLNPLHFNNKIVKENQDETNEYNKYMNSFSLRSIFIWLFISIDKWVLEFFASTSDVGIYSVLNQIGYSPLTQLSALVMTFIGPYVFDKNSVEAKYTYRHKLIIKRGTIIFFMITLFLSILGFLFNKEIFDYFTGFEDIQYSYLLPYIIFSGGLFMTTQFISLKAMIKLKPSLLIVPSTISSIIGIILYVIFCYYYQLEGVVYACVISNIFLLITTIYYCNKE